MADPVRLLLVCGARPNFMKVAPVAAAVTAWNEGAENTVWGDASRRTGLRFSHTLVHTGQHYDPCMSGVFFTELGLAEPDHYLDVGSGTHAVQTADVLRRLEPVLVKESPDLVLVVGDVNSTLAAALCAAKLQIPVAHVEAGLRSGDREMPEELNRLLTDQLAELLFTTSEDANQHLAHEGVDAGRVHFVGNTMIDTLERLHDRALASDALTRLELAAGEYALVTLHRPTNVDDPAQLARVVEILTAVAERVPVFFPVHARTRARMRDAGLAVELGSPGFKAEAASHAILGTASRLRLVEPLGYLDFVAAMAGARFVLTDSGGVQEETTVLGIPCLTMRTTTERPVTVTAGTNRLVDPYDPAAVIAAVDETLAAPSSAAGTAAAASAISPVRPPLWDGHAAERIVAVMAGWARSRQT